MVKQEVAKVLKSTQSNKEGRTRMNFIHTPEYAGMASFSKNKAVRKTSWIVDTGASSHICTNPDFFVKLKFLKTPISVNLPNGNTVEVTQVGTILFNGLKLAETLFLPILLTICCQ